MKLSSRAQYATRAMLELALHYGEGPVLLKDIAHRQELSARYLEHIITPLKAAGLVKSTRGAQGGFVLAKPPSEIKISDIVLISEGSIAPVECVERPEICPRNQFCAARDIWTDLKEAMNRVLESITLQDLVEQQRRKEQLKAGMYHI